MRLRFGYVVKCIGMKDGVVHCTYHPDSRSGTPGADKYKVKGNIHWVSAKHALCRARCASTTACSACREPGKDARLPPGPQSRTRCKTVNAQLEPALRDAKSGDSFQFERHGYFVADSDASASTAP